MSDVKTSKLRATLNEVAPDLDFVLDEGPLGEHQFMGACYELPRDLKRRGGICYPTSWLLREALKQEGICSTAHVKMSEITINGDKRMTQHVMLKTLADGGKYLDPTYQQFFRYVGLTPEVAGMFPEVAALYPENDIAIIDPNSTDFQETFAEYAHHIDLALPNLALIGSDRAYLKGTTLREKVDAYKQVWDIDTYKPMNPPSPDLGKAIMQSAALLDRIELL